MKSLDVRYYIIVAFISYISLLCLTIGSAFYFSFTGKEKIAAMITLSTRENLLRGDYRSALRIIATANNHEFSKVSYFINENRVFSFDSSNSEEGIFDQRMIKIDLSASDSKNSRIGYLVFFYKIDYILIISSIILLVYIPIGFLLNRLLKNWVKKHFENERHKYLSLLASQVAHDIRSPLSTIDMVASNLEEFDEERLSLLQSAAKRIHGIADGLLDYNRNLENSNISLELIDPAESIRSIIAEKKIQYSSYKLDFNSYVSCVSFKGIELEFNRLLSNLINNAIEASDKHDHIEVTLEYENENIVIAIKDHGKGIPKELIDKLGERGISIGKKNGNGLGIFHAKSIIEEWGGSLYIISTEGMGTTVSIELPAIMNTKRHIVLLDDDELLRLTWESKAKTLGIDLITFGNSVDLFNSLSSIPKHAEFYIDSCLSGNERGEIVAQNLFDQGISNIYLATGYNSEEFTGLDFIRGIRGKDFPSKKGA